MAEEILINVTAREVRVALLDNGVLQEIHIERYQQKNILCNIYKGKINRLLPGIQAAFVDIGLERSAFLHISDLSGNEHLKLANNFPIDPKSIPPDVDIRDFLKVGQELLVQAYKEPIGSKGARLTTQFTIPSRYLVLTPNLFQISVSQKIANEEERNRLQSLIQVSEIGGYIFRTAAEGMTQSQVDQDKAFLDTVWREVRERIKQAKPGDIVYEEISILLRTLRDFAGYEVTQIRVDQAEAYEQMRNFAKRYIPNLVDRIQLYSDPRPIFDIYAVEEELQKALLNKVNLKSGGYLVFEQTEAMTTIDVNTGSYLGKNNLEQTIFKTNLEAAEAIARQIRLRNLGGIIIVDFIDMTESSHKDQLLQAFQTALAKDSAHTEISELSSLGLLQMTRKRTRESLEHILCETCPECQRRGSIKSLSTIAYEIFREIKRLAQFYPWPGFEIVASQKVINFILEDEATMLADLESQIGKPLKVRIEMSFRQENYNILPMAEREH